ncbi:hypothetical protein BLA29_015568, partial [Euroglyphus maynei]
MFCQQVTVGAPAVGQADQRAEADLVDPGAPQTIRRGQTPMEILLLAAQVVLQIGGRMVGFLIHQ